MLENVGNDFVFVFWQVCRVTYKGIMQYMEHIQGKKHVKNVRDKMSGSFMVRVEPFEFS